MLETPTIDGSIERRYLALIRLSTSIAGASSWQGAATAVGDALRAIDSPSPVRLWGTTAEGFSELARDPADAELGPISQRELRLAAEQETTTFGSDRGLLLGLHAAGVRVGVLEVTDPGEQAELLAQAAPIVASATGLLTAQGVGMAVLEPLSTEAADDASSVMSAFAAQAKRLLDHDRLSAYLLTSDRRAFERFAVATSPIVPGEEVVIPLEDVGLRHVVITNRALVSEDLSQDPRIVGREDRVIARAGFRGLLSVPLRREGRPIGLLNFVSKTPGYYREEYVPIAQQIADQVSAFVENLRRQGRLRALVKRDAAERERARMTRDLYHTVAQAVPAINEIATDLRERLTASDAQAAAQVERIIELADLELADVRRAAIGMSPRALQSHRLCEVVESSLVRFGETAGIKTSWTLEGDTAVLPGAVQRCTYMILQEALTNVRLHSGAGSVRVRLEVGEGLTLAIADDGQGFDPESAATGPGLGLEGMTERAGALGGSVSVESERGHGTRVRFELPTVSGANGDLATAREELGPSANGGSTGTLRAFVADAHNLVRAGMISVLERAGGIRVVGEARSAEEIRGQIARLRPDVILLDDRLEAESSLTLTKELRSSSPNSAILVTVRHAVSGAAELLEAGGSGSIHTGVEPEELVDAVRAVANGAKLIAGPDEPANGGGNASSSLTPRERGILRLVAAGKTNAEIAESLFFATKTVERHVAMIVGKLGARNRAHAAALAVSRQMIEVDDG